MSVRYESPTIRSSAVLLGVIGAACVVAMTWLAWSRVPIPDALASIGGAAVGALATLLTTFTPSPVPGGRRAADTPAVVGLDEESAGNVSQQARTIGAGPSGVGGKGSDAAQR